MLPTPAPGMGRVQFCIEAGLFSLPPYFLASLLPQG